MPEIINRQRKIKIETAAFQIFIEKAIGMIGHARGKDLTVAFVSDRKIKQLNKTFRDKNKTTDILSFPDERGRDDFPGDDNFLGDIIISAEQAARQAAENNLSVATEIKQLILHGILHLCGYDHETDAGAMNRLELKLRDKLEIDE